MTVTYYLFGIPIWSVKRTISVSDKEALYREFADRFGKEINEALIKTRGGGQ